MAFHDDVVAVSLYRKARALECTHCCLVANPGHAGHLDEHFHAPAVAFTLHLK